MTAQPQPHSLGQSDLAHQIVLDAYGDPEAFRLESLPLPTPGPGEVRVKVLAASVQYTDTLIRRGLYPDVPHGPPLVLGYDVIGEIEAVGPGVRDRAVGDRVADLTMIGSYATHRLLEASRCTKVPDGLDAAEAAGMVLSGVTAYQLLHRAAKVKPGERLLVIAAGGAVGRLAVELAVAHGVEVLASARPHHHDTLRALGATPVEAGRELDAVGEGVDAVLDGLGLGGFRPSFRALRPGGRLVAFGVSDLADTSSRSLGTMLRAMLIFARLRLWNGWPNRRATSFYSITADRERRPEEFREDLAALFGLLGEGRVASLVEDRIGLGDVAEAHRRIARGGLRGKLVLVPSA